MALPKQAIVTILDPDDRLLLVIQGLAQVQGRRVLVQQPNGAWGNYKLEDCTISWDPERQPKKRAH